MPTGNIKWFDPSTGKGRVTRRGKEYPIAEGEAERDAQVLRARVHFDIKRRGGVDWAVNVRLCRGTRVHRLQHRFGDLAGRRSHPVVGERDPSTLAGLWMDAVTRGDVDAATLLYAPDACIHVGGEVVLGRESVRSHLERAFVGTELAVTAVDTPDERTAVVHFAQGDDHARRETRLRAEHDEIVEQWL